MKQTKRKQKQQLTTNDYATLFHEILVNDTPIYSTKDKDKRFIAEDEEIFMQCYADTPTRKTFPKYWFISNKCNLISIENGKPKWIEGYKKNKTGKCYKYIIHENDTFQRKNIEAHNLVGLVFNSEVYGKAKELLEQDGVFSFGVKNNAKLSNTGHHKDSNRGNNAPNNIQIITNRVHTLLDTIPNHNASEEKQIEYMQKIGKILEQEEPHKATIIFTGDTYSKETGEYIGNDGNISIHALNSITLTKEALMQVLGGNV